MLCITCNHTVAQSPAACLNQLRMLRKHIFGDDFARDVNAHIAEGPSETTCKLIGKTGEVLVEQPYVRLRCATLVMMSLDKT